MSLVDTVEINGGVYFNVGVYRRNTCGLCVAHDQPQLCTSIIRHVATRQQHLWDVAAYMCVGSAWKEEAVIEADGDV